MPTFNSVVASVPWDDTSLNDQLNRLSGLSCDDRERGTLRNAIVEATLPSADRLARRFSHRGEPLEDLTQVARLALVHAVDGFDPRRGGGFGRYAVPTILGELKRHFRDKAWSVRVPRRLQETRLELNTASAELGQRLGRTPTVADLAQHMDIEATQVRAAIDCGRAYTAISLQSAVDPESGTELVDLLGGDDPELGEVEDRELLRPLLARLPRRERDILLMRFVDGMTQAQIADKVGLSQMHVSRLLSHTLCQLRGWLSMDVDH